MAATQKEVVNWMEKESKSALVEFCLIHDRRIQVRLMNWSDTLDQK